MTILILRSSGGGGVGDLTHGQTATISGSGFGAVASPTYLYDDFSTGTLDALVRSTSASDVGTWETGAGDENVYRSNAVSRGVHSRVAYHNMRASGGGSTASLCVNDTFSGYWLVDWWQRTALAPANDNPYWTRNHKVFRVYETDQQGDSITLTHNGPGQEVQTQFFIFSGTNEYVYTPFASGQWTHNRLMWYVGATYDQDSLRYEYARNGTTRSTIYSGGLRNSSAENDEFPIEIRLGHYWAHDDGGSGWGSNAGADIHTSTVLIQRTWARVELGNHATYASATICEAQRTISRTNTDIEYEVNQGLLSSGSVYEYVFDASNTLVKTTQRTLT